MGTAKTSISSQKSHDFDTFLALKADGVFYVSHASILIKLSGKTFLCDPVLSTPPHFGSWLFYPKMIVDARFLDVDGVIVSHQHRDHFDPGFLKQLRPGTPIYILQGRDHFKSQFKEHDLNIIEIPTNRKFRLNSGIELFGMQHERNNIDSSMIISSEDFTVYHGNDNFMTKERMKIFSEQHDKIDVACIPFAFVHWYPHLLDNVDEAWKLAEAHRLIDEHLAGGLDQIDALNPELVIPFGANMFYFDSVNSDHNKAVVNPFNFLQFAKAKNFPRASAIKPLFAGDFIYRQNGALSIARSSATHYSEESLLDGLQDYVARVSETGTGWDLAAYERQSPSARDYDLSFIAKRMNTMAKDHPKEKARGSETEAKPLASPHMVYISNDENWDGIIAVNLHDLSVTITGVVDDNLPYHHFKLTDIAFKIYMSNEYAFNEIVASSRFRIEIEPNIYNIEALRVINNVL